MPTETKHQRAYKERPRGFKETTIVIDRNNLYKFIERLKELFNEKGYSIQVEKGHTNEQFDEWQDIYLIINHNIENGILSAKIQITFIGPEPQNKDDTTAYFFINVEPSLDLPQEQKGMLNEVNQIVDSAVKEAIEARYLELFNPKAKDSQSDRR